MTPAGRLPREPGELGTEIARLYKSERMSLRQIGRRVGLAHTMVLRYLQAMGIPTRSQPEGNELERRLRPEPEKCPWPGCVAAPMVTPVGYRLGACVRHVKLALGLMTS